MSASPYQEYQDSGLDWVKEVPSHWQKKPFFSLVRERHDSNSGMKNENLLSLSYGRIKRKDLNTLDGLLPASFETYQVVQPEDLVFRLTDLQNDKRSLRSAIVLEKGIITSAYLAVRCVKIKPQYANYLFRSYDLSKVFYSMGGGLRQSMKYSDMKWLLIYLPPENEQTQIARFLDYETARIDALIEEQQRLIELLKEKRQAVISHAVTKGLDPHVPMKDSGVEWLGEVPAYWKVAKLKWNARINSGDGISPNRIEIVQDEENTIPVIGGNGVMGYTSSWNVCLRVIAIGRVGALCGNVHLLTNLAFVSDNALVLTPDQSEFDMEYLAFVLVSRDLNDLADKNAQPLITGSKVLNQHVPCPKKDEQLEIVLHLKNTLAYLDALEAESAQTIDLLRERRSALISAAVTGKIDVRDWQPPADNNNKSAQPEAAHG